MRARGIKPENEIFLILLIVLLYAFKKPKYVDAALSLNIRKSFSSNTAKISEELKIELLEIAREIDQKSRNHDFDGLEIIGHADTAPKTRPNSRGRFSRYDLDNALAAYLNSEAQSANLSRAATILANSTVSNTELAMIRAVVVTQYFQELKKEGLLFQNIDYFVPMSAGAIVQTDYRLDTTPTGKGDATRRRIEFQLFSTEDRARDDLKTTVE